MDKLQQLLNNLNFNRVDFVAEPGEYSVRGGIVDIYSYSEENPYRLEFFDDEIESIRSFNISQLIKQENHLTVTQIQNLILKPKEKAFKLLFREYYNMVKGCFICKDYLNDLYNNLFSYIKKINFLVVMNM